MFQKQFLAIAFANLFPDLPISAILFCAIVLASLLNAKFVKSMPIERDFSSEISGKSKAIIAQNNSSSKIDRTNTNSSIDYSRLEREILAEINKARLDPIAYASWLESTKQYFDGIQFKLPGEKAIKTNKGLEALKETVAFLKNVQPLEALNKNEELTRSARDKIAIITNKTNSNHTISNQENISYGRQTAPGIVMQLIVDSGVSDRPHRRNIFNANSRTTGIAGGDDLTYGNMCVITFSDRDSTTTTSKSNLNNPNKLFLSKNGSLAKGDATLSNDGSFYDFYPFKGRAGDVFVVEVNSQEFDPFVAIVDSTGKTIAQNDDLDDRNSNSRLQLTLPGDGEYRIIINSYQEKGRGRYTLKVSN
ncbi:MAG: hypothetical protein ACRC2V_07435 [Xenococcaceae cyanobacterium]